MTFFTLKADNQQKSFLLPQRKLLFKTALSLLILLATSIQVFSASLSNGLAMDIVVRGQVTDAKGETLPGVSIKIKGSTVGTSSDNDGRYSITAPENATLVFSYIGYTAKEVAVNGRSTINVTLEPNATNIDEVVVTALGVKREAKSLTYSTQGVSTEELTEARSLNVMNSLQGKVAGLTIETAGTGVGGSARVLLRGNRSINMAGNGSGPLYVVDGVPSSGIQNISPDNIESVNVLKGPNAAALYGSAAQNGAIIIETKKGKAGVAKISLNETFITGSPIHNFEPQNVYGQGLGGNYQASGEESWGPKMLGQMVTHWTPDPAHPQFGKQVAFSPQPDNFKDVFQNSQYVTHNFNATMGSENTQMAFNFTREDARGMMQNNELRRNDASIRVNSQLKKWLSLDAKLNYIRNEVDNENGTGDNAYTNPYMNIYNLPRNISNEDLKQFEYRDAGGNNRQHFWLANSTIGRNPYWVMNRHRRYETGDRLMALASATIKFTDRLSFMARTSFDGGSNTLERQAWADSYGGGQEHLGLYNLVLNGPSQSWNSDAILSYNGNLTKDLNLSSFVGGHLRTSAGSGRLTTNTNGGLIIPNFFALTNAATTPSTFLPFTGRETQSLYFSTSFGWKNKIYLDVTGRNDWSSTLPSESRSYFYPSVGLSAIISDLIPSLPEAVSYAKIRANYAEVGNDPQAGQGSRDLVFDGTAGNFGFYRLGNVLPASDLKPERTKAYEIGLDTRFFNGRLGLDISAYKTNTYNQLFRLAVPPGSGAQFSFTNGGDVENLGLEFVLTGTPVQTSNFSWDISSNFATNKNTVKKIHQTTKRLLLLQESYMYDYVVQEGDEFGDVYTKGYLRDAQGRVLVGANGVPRVTTGRTFKAANFNPDWTGAISNSLSYKNISLGFLIEHRQGGTLVSSTDALLAGEGVTEATLEGRDGGLIFGKNFFANEIAVKADGTPNDIPMKAETFWKAVGGRNTPIGEPFVESATNTRLREATLGFTLPKSLFTKLPFVSNAKLTLVGRNLFFIQRSGSWDPEILAASGTTAGGWQTYLPPTERTFGLNLKLDF